MKKIAYLVGLILLAGCTSSGDVYETMRVSGLIHAWESGVESSFDVSTIVSGGSEYYGCVLASGNLPQGVSIGGYNGCEISGTITLNPGTSKLITPPVVVLVSDDVGNYLNISVSLTIVEQAPQVYGNYFECVVGQVCNERLASVSGGSEPYTYRLGSMSYGIMPPGTTLGVDGYLTGIPTTAGEYSFELCVIDSNDVVSCAYPSVNVVSDESELGQNWLYSNDYSQESDENVTLTLLKAGSSEPSMIYLETYENVLECTDYPCTFTFNKGESVKLNSFFNSNTYFDKWQGAECYLDGIIDDELNRSECIISMDNNLTVTAYFNKRPTIKLTRAECIFKSYDSRWPDSKIWGVYEFVKQGTVTSGSVGTKIEIINEDYAATYTIDCGAWTKETNEYGEIICVRKATDPDTTTFSIIDNEYRPQGSISPLEVLEIVQEYSGFIWASDSKEVLCPYE